jgi:hydrogenase maturation protease
MSKFQQEVLVIGFGSDILTDDQIGLKLVNDLRTLIRSRHVRFETLLLLEAGMLGLLRDADILVLMDGIKTAGSVTGDVHIYPLSDGPVPLHLINYHDFTLPQLLSMATELGLKVPAKVWVMAVEIEENTMFGKALSGVLQERYAEILERAKTFIGEMAGLPVS